MAGSAYSGGGGGGGSGVGGAWTAGAVPRERKVTPAAMAAMGDLGKAATCLRGMVMSVAAVGVALVFTSVRVI